MYGNDAVRRQDSTRMRTGYKSRTIICACAIAFVAAIFVHAIRNVPRPDSRVHDTIDAAFASHKGNIQVEQHGQVLHILPDDMEGSRHQRFIVELPSGLTVLIIHNIDIAPRIDSLREGKEVSFRGEYEWNEKGGVVHWTHHDPRGLHDNGWIEYQGRRYH